MSDLISLKAGIRVIRHSEDAEVGWIGDMPQPGTAGIGLTMPHQSVDVVERV